jgi:hypothetical protein
MKYDSFVSGLECYNKLGGNYPILIGEDIEGDTFNTLEEWHAYPYKYEIMNKANQFKHYLRTLKVKKPSWLYPSEHDKVGRIGNSVNTPIGDERFIYCIDDFIYSFEKRINGECQGHIPKSLTDTDLGRNILDELKNAKFSTNVFCHNYLCYKSFVVKDNKLIGIRNWQYAGFFPPEFEDIIQTYLDNI